MAEKSFDFMDGFIYIAIEVLLVMMFFITTITAFQFPTPHRDVWLGGSALVFIWGSLWVWSSLYTETKKKMMKTLRKKVAIISSEMKTITCQSSEAQCLLLRELTDQFIECAQSVENATGMKVEYTVI